MFITDDNIELLLKLTNDYYIPILFSLMIGYYNNTEFITRLIYLLFSVQSIKVLTNRTRPNKSDKLSFPSGHTAVAFFVAFNMNNIYIYIWAILASLSRVYFEYHYYSDIVGGVILSYIIYFRII